MAYANMGENTVCRAEQKYMPVRDPNLGLGKKSKPQKHIQMTQRCDDGPAFFFQDSRIRVENATKNRLAV